MNNIILLERDFYMEYLPERKRIPELTVDQLIDKYQGFEGELILCHPLTSDPKVMDSCLVDYFELKDQSNELILFVLENSFLMPPIFKEKSQFLGYDVGLCEDDATLYSSIFNEVLFGPLEELISYKDTLNENLLFSEKSIADSYVALHDELSAQGKDVEDYFKMHIYEIWKPHEPIKLV